MREMVPLTAVEWHAMIERPPREAYPPKVARHFSRVLADLVEYRQHRPNLGNFEGQCPSRLLARGRDLPAGAKDALRPDQAEMVATFVESQRAGK